MPVYQVDTQKINNGVYWTNVWHVIAATLSDAHIIARQIGLIEASELMTYMRVELIRTSEVGPGGTFVSEQVTYNGGRVQSGTDNPMPAWNRYLIGLVPDSGFHGKKFLLWMLEGDQDNGSLVQSTQQRLVTNIAIPLDNLAALCSPKGVPYTSVNVISTVGMRQLRRHRKRTTPVINP